MVLNITAASYAPFVGAKLSTKEVFAASGSFDWTLTKLNNGNYRYSCNNNNDFVIGRKI